MAKGGYRKPNNPAPVSGPGALSRRTDGGAGSKQAMKEIRTGKYGESKAIMEQQQGAPLAGNPTPSPQMAVPKVAGLMEPTQRPSEPVTQGMPFGPGANSIKPAFDPNAEMVDFKTKYLRSLQDVALLPNAPQSFKRFVSYLEGFNQ